MEASILPKILVLVTVCLGLVSCDSRYKPEQVLFDYANSLSRSAYIDVSIPAFKMPELYPSIQERIMPLTEFDVSLLDFLSLQHCDVGYLVGERNSVLGRVMVTSQRFLYEVNITRALETCPIKNQSIEAKLRPIAKQKHKELPNAFINAVFNSDEAKQFFSLSNGFVPMSYSMANYQALQESLDRLLADGRQVMTLPKLDGNVFEGDLKTVADSEYGGQLLYSLAQITRYLNGVSHAIETFPKSVCGPPVRFLKQQFDQHYIHQIQPYMARLNATAYLLLPRLAALAKVGQPLPDALQHYLDQYSLTQDSSVWMTYQAASQRHAKAWSQLFSRCSVSLH